MKKLIKYFKPVHWTIWLILFFCLIGIFRNFYQLTVFGYDYSHAASKVLWAMLVVYSAQAALILARESKAWLLSAIQTFFCFYVYADFTFLPVITFIQNVIWRFAPDMDYGWARFLAMAGVSALFSLELLKTYLLFALTEEPSSRRRVQKRAAKAAGQPV